MSIPRRKVLTSYRGILHRVIGSSRYLPTNSQQIILCRSLDAKHPSMSIPRCQASLDVNFIANNFLKALVFLLLILCLFTQIESQTLIPKHHDGFWFGNKTGTEDTVLIEAFFDPVCPDSRDSWPPLKKAIHRYGSRVRLVVHTFPLPYHDNAFSTSRALHIINNHNTSATFELLEAFFKHQERFYGAATVNISKADVRDLIMKFVTKELGTSYSSVIKSGYTDPKIDHETRISFKYGCLRGVYGTPYFFVNGFPLPDAGSSLDYKGWRKIIDPLLSTEKKHLHFF